MKFKIFLSLGILISIQSCYTDVDDDPVLVNPNNNQTDIPSTENHSFNGVDQRLWTYFTSFEAEAKKRNLNLDLNALEITGVIEEINEENVAGSCQFGNHIHHVTIDQTFWNNSSVRGREFVVYHELGHCALARGHREESNNEGLCLSIMASGLGGCQMAYNNVNREAYLDELFLNN